MGCRTPESSLTIHLSESGLKKLLDTYRFTRPEEFRIVSVNFVPDGDTDTMPIVLNKKGNALDYAVRLVELSIDLYPPQSGLESPIPPTENQFHVTGNFTFDLRDFSEAEQFHFPLTIWLLCETKIVLSSGIPVLKLIIKDLKLSGIEPDKLRDLLEYVLLLILRHAVYKVEIPTTAGVESLIRFVLLDKGIKDNSIQLYAGVQIPEE